jgi:hypothetical protein
MKFPPVGPEKTGSLHGFRLSRLLLLVPALLLTGLALLATASCGSSTSSSDLKVETTEASKNITLPSWVSAPGTPKNSAVAYRFALERPDLLSQMPCYCGCGESAGHISNLDCFIKSRNGDQVVFDQHGAG